MNSAVEKGARGRRKSRITADVTVGSDLTPFPFSYVNPTPSLRMTTKYDRPEGYNLMSKGQRTSVRGSIIRAKSSMDAGVNPSPEDAIPRSASTDVGRQIDRVVELSGVGARKKSTTGGTHEVKDVIPVRMDRVRTSAPNRLREQVKSASDRPKPGVLAEIAEKRARQLAGLPPVDSITEQMLSKSDGHHTISPSSVKTKEVKTMPLSEANLRMYRPEPRNPMTGVSQQEDKHRQRVAAWVDSLPVDEDASQIVASREDISLMSTGNWASEIPPAAVTPTKARSPSARSRPVSPGLRRGGSSPTNQGDAHPVTPPRSGAEIIANVDNMAELERHRDALMQMKLSSQIAASINENVATKRLKGDTVPLDDDRRLRRRRQSVNLLASLQDPFAGEELLSDAASVLSGNTSATTKQHTAVDNIPTVYEATVGEGSLLHVAPSDARLNLLQQQMLLDGLLGSPEVPLGQPGSRRHAKSKPKTWEVQQADEAPEQRRSGRTSRASSLVSSEGDATVPLMGRSPPTARSLGSPAHGVIPAALTTAALEAARQRFNVPSPGSQRPIGIAPGQPSEHLIHDRKWNSDYQRLMDRIFLRVSPEDVMQQYSQLRSLRDDFHESCRRWTKQELCTSLMRNVSMQVRGITFTLLTVHIPGEEEEKVLATKVSPRSGDDDEDVNSNSSIDVLEATMKEARQHRRSTLVNYITDPKRRKSVSLAVPEEELDDEAHDTLVEAHIEELEARRRMAKNEVDGQSVLARHWSACTTFGDVPAGCPVPSGEESTFEFIRNRALENVEEGPHGLIVSQIPKRSVVFPLTCLVHHMGHVVCCTAALPRDLKVEPSFASGDPTTKLFLGRLAKELGSSSYLAQQGVQDPTEEDASEAPQQQDSRPTLVDISRSVLVGYSRNEGRRYLISTVGILPPLLPSSGSNKWMRIRWEFVATHWERLCSDCFLPKTMSDATQKAREHSKIVRASRRMVHKNITDLLDCFSASKQVFSGSELCEAMHARGINLAFLGRITESLEESLRSFSKNREKTSEQQEILTKLLSVAREEMCVRAFRNHLNSALRRRMLEVVDPSPSMQLDVVSETVGAFLGSEGDTDMHLQWIKRIAPAVRKKFDYRGIVGRKDVSISRVSTRLFELCGVTLGDMPDAPIAKKTDEILKTELRSNRACLVGGAIGIDPCIKETRMPVLPKLLGFFAAATEDIQVVVDDEIAIAGQRFGARCYEVVHLMDIKQQLLRLAGDKFYSSAERVMLRALNRQRDHPVPDNISIPQTHLQLASLYYIEHRYSAAEMHLDQLVTLEAAHHKESSRRIPPALKLLGAVCKDGGNRELAITSLERCCYLLHVRLRQLENDPIRGHVETLKHEVAEENKRRPVQQPTQDQRQRRKKAEETEPSPSETNLHLCEAWSERHRLAVEELDAAMEELVIVYGMMELDEMPQFHPQTINREFLMFLHTLGRRELEQYRLHHSNSAFQRCLALARQLHEAHAGGSTSSPTAVGANTVDACIVNADLVSGALQSASS